jgi:ABC-type antimicrobial peptide transport system permease subunit
VGREVVAIIGRSFAEQQWPGRSPLGARIRIESVSEWATVVGVAAGVSGIGRSSATDRLQVYFARAQSRPGFGAIVVRTAGDPAALIPAIKARVWTIDSKLPLSDIATADQLMARTTSQARFNLALLLSFAGCGLGLAMVGVYGVMSLFVGLRQRELGIRMALGASTAAVASLVFRQSAAVLFYGVAIGAAGAAMLSGLLQKLLFETPPRDTASFVVASAAIVVAASAATVIPLRRATKVDPAIVLRGD